MKREEPLSNVAKAVGGHVYMSHAYSLAGPLNFVGAPPSPEGCI